jgi:hypothetical protein
MRALATATIVFVVAGVGLWTVDAPVARGIVERSLPGFVEQSEAAESTAEYRRNALEYGITAAKQEPMGIGLLPADAMTVAGVDLGYVAHSGVTTMLVYAGWIGLAAAVLTLLSLLWASFRAPRPIPWLHPFFVGSFLMLMVYSFAASGLVGQGWVIGLAALIAALRFHAAGAST